jgi:hypothetical protein
MKQQAVHPDEPVAPNEGIEQAEQSVATPDNRRRREVARIASAVIVVMALVALAVMAIAAARSDWVTQALARPPTVEPGAPPVATDVADRPSAPRPTLSGIVAAPDAARAPAPTPAPAPLLDAPSPPPADRAEPEPPPVRECALGLPPPQPGGGVASLTPLVPFFGPFSAEAFTMMPAFEPAFPMIAPLLSAGEPLLEQADPVLSALAPPAQELEQAVFDPLAPFYAPYRQSFLDAEADFAAAFAPLAESMATAPGTECIVALEGMLVAPSRPQQGGG